MTRVRFKKGQDIVFLTMCIQSRLSGQETHSFKTIGYSLLNRINNIWWKLLAREPREHDGQSTLRTKIFLRFHKSI